MTTDNIKIGLAVALLLECAGGLSPTLGSHLPLSDSPLAQLGFVLGVAVAIPELQKAFRAKITRMRARHTGRNAEVAAKSMRHSYGHIFRGIRKS